MSSPVFTIATFSVLWNGVKRAICIAGQHLFLLVETEEVHVVAEHLHLGLIVGCTEGG